jgi:benzoyl-CoA reductase subunit C
MGSIDVEPTMDIFRQAISDPYKIGREWKRQGEKVVGCRCIYIPEEIIWAAGMLPYPIYGTPDPIGPADAYFQSCACEFIRNVFDHGLKGNLSFVDHLVVANTCEFLRGLCNLWSTYIQDVPISMLNNPLKLMNNSNRDYYCKVLEQFKTDMEQLSGKKITDEKLYDAITLYNETRALLKELYMLRKQDPPPISGEDAFTVAMASTLMPKDQVNPLLRRFLEDIKDRGASENFGPRIMVTGSIIDHPALIRMVEEEGGIVVIDDLCTTSRYFWDQVEDLKDPIEALYKFENGRPLCSCTHPMEFRMQHLHKLIDEFNVEAVIYFNVKYCHPMAYEGPMVKEELEAMDIPMTVLEVSHDMSGLGQLRTRIQAFVEMVEL